MAEFADNGSWARVRVDAQFAEFLHDSRIFSSVKPEHPTRWTDRNFVSFFKTTQMEPYTAVYMGEPLYEMGSFSFVTTPFNISTYGLRISFGRYCSIGGGAQVIGPAHPLSTLSTATPFFDGTINIAMSHLRDEGVEDYPFVARPTPKGPPVIGHDVWFGGHVWLNTGVRIGNGAVIANNSSVTRNVPDYAIMGGNPAQVIRYRFPQEIIAQLQELQPWNYSMSDLRHFDLSDIEKFVVEFGNARAQVKPYMPKKAHLWNAYREIHKL